MRYSIGLTLKTKRRSAGLSVDDVAAYLHKNGISVANKTIYEWENEFAFPPINTFLLLCEFYGIEDILNEFKEKPEL